MDLEWLLAVLGCVLGFTGWRTARRASAEVAALRATLAATAAPAVTQPAATQPAASDPAASDPAASDPAPSRPAPPAALVLAQFGPPPPPRPRIDVELLLTQRWGVWLGSVALLFAGVFLVRTALEQGWLGPAARCALGGLLGLGLIAAAALLRRRPAPAVPPAFPLADQTPSALAAGGTAALFAAAYAAGPLYALLPPLAAFALLAAVALAGLALSLSFGRLVAAVGLVAAFATPALVQDADPSLPGLFAYLFVVSAACWAVVRLTAWVWLGWGAAGGGAAWVLLAALSPPGAAVWAAGLFVPLAAALTLALLPAAALDTRAGRRFAWAPMLLLGLAGLALTAATADPWARLGLLLLAPVAVARAWTEPRLARLPMVAAGLGLLALLAWALPPWSPTGEVVSIEGVVQAVLPGAWVPEAILPFLQACAAFALLHAGVGLWGERRGPRPLPWAALAAAVPVATLAVAYLQVGRFQPPLAWATAALALSAALVGAAGLARRAFSGPADPLPLQRAGTHAAGAVAALSLAFAILLDAAWLTVALALLLPPLALIECAAQLPALRRVALAVAAVVLARLALNPYVPEYGLGTTPVFNLLLIAYGVPTACFALAAALFRRTADDRAVATLEAGACLFAGLSLVLETHHASNGGVLTGDLPSFEELSWATCLLGALATLLLAFARRSGRAVPRAAGRAWGLLAWLGGLLLLLFCPLWAGDLDGPTPRLAWLSAYAIPALLAALAAWQGARPRRGLAAYALLAAVVACWVFVRQAFHPGAPSLDDAATTDAELWALSGAWFVLSAAVLGAGFAFGQRALRLAGLGLMGLVAAKVFLVDMSGLDGLWRVLSFLGLGLGLIGLGAIYRRVGVRA